MTQYTDYGSIPQAVRDLIANKISLLDSYILMQTGEYEYTALVYKHGINECRQYQVERASGSGYGSYLYRLKESAGVWEYTVTNEYYCYSNVGYGAALDLPVVDLSIAHSSVIMACALMLAIVFKGVLFPCMKKR